MLRQLLLVALGGAIGSAMRYLTAILLARHYTGSIPLATLVVNVLGCFLIGLLIGLCSETTYLRLLFITGFCGGFTTFSTFTAESYVMFREGAYGLALLYIAGSVLIGLLALWVGLYVSRIIAS
ncbi:fluoride efflux transporter CrcB [uncultured Porphyromonas sp.]|jgi:CrcB protein|uniref:fluoride efflux transporter CrcB n=1 Tax=uncultured Porphyromonas sp. TaxID=159274 RepID=UPI0026087025|nr:fluoride efflux transporter CrcB [uncultured Porphyromonas sp.]